MILPHDHYIISKGQLEILSQIASTLSGVDLRYTNMLAHRTIQNQASGIDSLVKFISHRPLPKIEPGD